MDIYVHRSSCTFNIFKNLEKAVLTTAIYYMVFCYTISLNPTACNDYFNL